MIPADQAPPGAAWLARRLDDLDRRIQERPSPRIVPVAPSGTAVLAAGSVNVPTVDVTTTSRVYLTCQVPGGTPGALYVSARVASESFTISSTSGSDTSTVAWMIVNP
jgi:hypothetical protein